VEPIRLGGYGKAGGTGIPIEMSSPRFAFLPPTRLISVFRRDSNGMTNFEDDIYNTRHFRDIF
ncbi:MAG: hypothetical protein QXX14_04465, partial [Candidatus Methanomethyliaceae archaeon]